MILEGYAARCAATTLTESDLTKMETVNRQIEAASEKKDLRRLLDLHNEFHDIFLRFVREREAPRDRAEPGHAVPALPPDPRHAGKDRRVDPAALEIIDAFRKHDSELAEELVRKKRPLRQENPSQGTGEGLILRRRCPNPEDFAASVRRLPAGEGDSARAFPAIPSRAVCG